MANQVKRLFSAEKKRLQERDNDISLSTVMDAINALDGKFDRSLNKRLDKLIEKLDVPDMPAVAEDTSKTTVDQIMAEIHAMNEHITLTKSEIAALKPVDEANTSLTVATEELSEVVKATEEAANSIMDSAEQISVLTEGIRGRISEGDPDGIEPEIDKLDYVGTDLLTACSFQDITGQRINKVVNALNYVEERLSKMIDIWQIENGTADTQGMVFASDDERDAADKNLLHGPQSEGLNQDDIDALFD